MVMGQRGGAERLGLLVGQLEAGGGRQYERAAPDQRLRNFREAEDDVGGEVQRRDGSARSGPRPEELETQAGGVGVEHPRVRELQHLLLTDIEGRVKLGGAPVAVARAAVVVDANQRAPGAYRLGIEVVDVGVGAPGAALGLDDEVQATRLATLADGPGDGQARNRLSALVGRLDRGQCQRRVSDNRREGRFDLPAGDRVETQDGQIGDLALDDLELNLAVQHLLRRHQNGHEREAGLGVD